MTRTPYEEFDFQRRRVERMMTPVKVSVWLKQANPCVIKGGACIANVPNHTSDCQFMRAFFEEQRKRIALWVSRSPNG